MKKLYPKVIQIDLFQTKSSIFSWDTIINAFTKIYTKPYWHELRNKLEVELINVLKEAEAAAQNDITLRKLTPTALLKELLYKTQPRCCICFNIATQKEGVIYGGWNEPPKYYHYCDAHATETAYDTKLAHIVRMARPCIKEIQ